MAIKQIQSQPTLPRSINPDIPEGLEEIVMRAMQKDADKRYQSAAEMLHDIDEFKRNPAIVFPTSTSSRRRYTFKTSCGISGQNNRQVENNSR